VLEVGIVQGRKISGVEIGEITALIEANPQWCRTQLSRVLAERWQWYAASGQLKDMAARSLLLKLHERGLIVLPQRRQEPRLRRPQLRRNSLIASCPSPSLRICPCCCLYALRSLVPNCLTIINSSDIWLNTII